MRKHIRKSSQAVALALVLASSSAFAGAWVGGGIEYFTWGEYLDYSVVSGGETVNRNADMERSEGFIPFVEANVDIPVTERVRLGVAGKVYSGSGQYNSKASPYSVHFDDTVDIKGVRVEGGFIFTPMPNGEHKDLSFVLNGGYETWTRKLKDVSAEEEWKVPFLRLGAQSEPTETSPWGIRGGLILPVNAIDEIKSSSTVLPSDSYDTEEAPSFYFGFGRRFGRFLEIGLNYQGYRFTELEAGSDYATPRVETDTYQLYAKMGF